MKTHNAGGSDGWRDKARWRNGNGLSCAVGIRTGMGVMLF